MKTKTKKVDPVVQAIIDAVPTAIATHGDSSWLVPHPAMGETVCSTCGSSEFEDECPAWQDAMEAADAIETAMLEGGE